MDIQRLGNVIYMRKYQDYKEGDLNSLFNSLGRHFEAACAADDGKWERDARFPLRDEWHSRPLPADNEQ